MQGITPPVAHKALAAQGRQPDEPRVLVHVLVHVLVLARSSQNRGTCMFADGLVH